MKKAKSEWTAYQAALDTLKTNADDGPANLLVGKQLLFVEQDWRKGLPHLAKSDHEPLAAAAVADLAAPSEPPQQVAAAELWEAAANDLAASEAKICRAMAAYWYQRALPALTGLRKVKVEKALKAIGDVPSINRGV
jgi:hypothetical protein